MSEPYTINDLILVLLDRFNGDEPVHDFKLDVGMSLKTNKTIEPYQAYDPNEYVVLRECGEILTVYEQNGAFYDSGRNGMEYADCEVTDIVWKEKAETFWNRKVNKSTKTL